MKTCVVTLVSYFVFMLPISSTKFSIPSLGTVIKAFVFSGSDKYGNEILEASCGANVIL